jgi:hypothetical protein
VKAREKELKNLRSPNATIAQQRKICEEDTFFYRFFTTKIRTGIPLPVSAVHGVDNAAREVIETRSLVEMLSLLLPQNCAITKDIPLGPACLNGMIWEMISFMIQNRVFTDTVDPFWDPNLTPNIANDVLPFYHATVELLKRYEDDAKPNFGDRKKMISLSPPPTLYSGTEEN